MNNKLPKVSTLQQMLRYAMIGACLSLGACTQTPSDVEPRELHAATQDQEIVIACRALVTDYAVLRDALDVEGYVALFAPEGELTLQGQTYVGHDAIRARMRRAAQGPRTRHLMSTIRITPIDERRARGVSYATIYAAPVPEEASESAGLIPVRGFAVVGDYVDEFVRTENGWRIASRSLRGVFRADTSD